MTGWGGRKANASTLRLRWDLQRVSVSCLFSWWIEQLEKGLLLLYLSFFFFASCRCSTWTNHILTGELQTGNKHSSRPLVCCSLGLVFLSPWQNTLGKKKSLKTVTCYFLTLQRMAQIDRHYIGAILLAGLSFASVVVPSWWPLPPPRLSNDVQFRLMGECNPSCGWERQGLFVSMCRCSDWFSPPHDNRWTANYYSQSMKQLEIGPVVKPHGMRSVLGCGDFTKCCMTLINW